MKYEAMEDNLQQRPFYSSILPSTHAAVFTDTAPVPGIVLYIAEPALNAMAQFLSHGAFSPVGMCTCCKCHGVGKPQMLGRPRGETFTPFRDAGNGDISLK